MRRPSGSRACWSTCSRRAAHATRCLIDRQGFVILHRRAAWAPKPPSLDSLATLIASNHSANVAIAQLFGEASFRETVQSSDGVGTYVEAVGDKALLVTVFDASAPLGKVKLFTKRALERIAAVLDGPARRPPVVDFGGSFSLHAGALLDELFDDGKTPMSTINFAAREINFKLVYYGPGLSGKTTNLKQIHAHVPGDSKGEMVSLQTEDERTLFFDFLPLDLGKVNGFKTRFHLYTVPGQVFYNASRRLILRGVDGVVFVADSAPNRLRANAESLRNLRENLAEYDLSLGELPYVIQVNKRDLADALPVDMIHTVLDPGARVPVFEAVAQEFQGVVEPLKAVSKLVLEKLAQKA